jgi:hypothetical protein
MPGRFRAAGILITCSVGLLLGVTEQPMATASLEQPTVVSAIPKAGTPQLVPSANIDRPRGTSVARLNGDIFVGGFFNTVSDPFGTTTGLQHLFSFNESTNRVNSGFVARANGEVFALDTGNGALYVGGVFRTINGKVTGPLAKLDPLTGAVDTTFKPPFTSGAVNQVVLNHGVLYVGGTFSQHLLALNPDTGANTNDINFNLADPIPNAFGPVAIFKFAVTNSGDRLVATGNFQQVNGQSRTRVFVANIDPQSGAASLSNWYYPGFAKPCSTSEPRRIAQLRGVDWSPDGSYFVVVGTGQISRRGDVWHPPPAVNPANTTVCDGAGRFDMSDDSKPHWINYTGGDSTWAAAVTGPAVYVQGHFQWYDNWDGFASQCLPAGHTCARRRGIAALDPATGMAIPSWNGDKPAMQGGKSFLVASNGLWVPSDSLTFHGKPHRGLAFVPLP